MPNDRFHLPIPGATPLPVRVWRAGSDPKGILLIHPGPGEDGGRHAGLAEVAARSGYHVHAPEYRDQGSAGAAGLFAGLDSLNREILRRHGALPRIAFGIGIGASLAAAALARGSPPFSALVAWNGLHDPGAAWLGRALVAVERFRLGSDAISRFGRRHFRGLPPGWMPTVAATRDILEIIAMNGRDATFTGLDRSLPVHLAGGRESEDFARRLAALGFSNVHLVKPASRAADAYSGLLEWLDRHL